MKIIIMYLRERHIMNYEFASVVNSLRHGRNRKQKTFKRPLLVTVKNIQV